MLDILRAIFDVYHLAVDSVLNLWVLAATALISIPANLIVSIKTELLRLWAEHPTAYVTGTTGILAASMAIFTIRKQRFISREKNSLDFQVTYKHNAEVNDCWKKVRKIARDEIEQIKLGQNSKSGSETAQALSTICNEWERCANAIKNDVYDEEFLYKVYASTVIGIYSDYGMYINERRKQNPKFFNNFIWLAERWSKRRREELKKKNHEDEKMMAQIEHGRIMTHITNINKMTERLKKHAEDKKEEKK
ncbi:DUF4760 domain-containing protein [Halomonas sp. DP5N14-9]|uniref:DUF4760 domain-containing protein n=1 Tax=Halomonas sp. DP5N14-9 TaxID=2859075 RepID=UPI001C98FE72|nr:DUF4760 domain-containing protein [Halomonas sp. DP5N14-9]MBY5940237.1 DUF4760 domain-containing protein [Halomonas sp. DP5N14-9]